LFPCFFPNTSFQNQRKRGKKREPGAKEKKLGSHERQRIKIHRAEQKKTGEAYRRQERGGKRKPGHRRKTGEKEQNRRQRERENQTKQRGKTEEKLGRANREKRPGTKKIKKTEEE
jgi:hypothetical protein